MSRGQKLAAAVFGALIATLPGGVVMRRPASTPRTGRTSIVAGMLAQFGEEAPLAVLVGGTSTSPAVNVRKIAPDVRALSRLRQVTASLGEQSTADRLSTIGLALLLMERPEQAMPKLQEAARLAPWDAWRRSDLAADYLAIAELADKPVYRLQALAAADQALAVDAGLPEALFNRALALESLSLGTAAMTAWRRYLQVDPSSAWAAQVRERLRRLTKVQADDAWEQSRAELDRVARGGDTRRVRAIVERYAMASRLHVEDQVLGTWGEAVLAGRHEAAEQLLLTARLVGAALSESGRNDALRDAVATIDGAKGDAARTYALAAGHRAYCVGRKAYDLHLLDPARTSLATAEERLRAGGSPFAASAALFRAATDYYSFDYTAALSRLARLSAAYQFDRYPILRGQTHWIAGTIHYLRGDVEKALADHRQAAAAFGQALEAEYVAAVENLMALDLEYTGESDASWKHRFSALRALDQVREPRRAYEILFDTATAALRKEMPGAALLFEDQAISWAERWQSEVAIAQSHQARSRIFLAARQEAPAHRDLVEAKRHAQQISDVALRHSIEGDILLLEGESLLARQPGAAIDHFSRALANYGSVGSEDFLADAYRKRASAWLAIGEQNRAAADLRSGIELYERRSRQLSDQELRVPYFDQSGELFSALIGLELGRHAEAAAFDYAERSRARSLLDLASRGAAASGGAKPSATQTMTSPQVQAALPAGVAVVAYTQLRDRLLSWVVRRGSLRLHQQVLQQLTLDSLIENLRAGMNRPVQSGDEGLMSRRLFDLLIRPILPDLAAGDALVFIPDGRLYSLPFATLTNAATGRRLIQDYVIATVPSATLFFRSARHDQDLAGAVPIRVLAVGNPAIDRMRFPDLPDLPGAAQEAATVAGFYRRSTLLLGRDASAGELRRFAPACQILHLAAHAQLNREAPAWSRLVLASSAPDDPGTIYAWQIRELPLGHTRIAVLSACSTAAGHIWSNEGMVSLASSFLAAGVPAVIAPLWNVEDHPTTQLMLALHRRLRQGDDPATALREAQLSMLYNADPGLRPPARWAAFEVIGGTSTLAASP